MDKINHAGIDSFLEERKEISEMLFGTNREFQDDRWEVPIINPHTGISLMYHEAIASHILKYINAKLTNLGMPQDYRLREANFQVANMILVLGQKIIRYEEMFTPTSYRNIVNDHNRSAVKKLDYLAEKANDLSFDDFEKNIYSPMMRVIRGNNPTVYQSKSSRLIMPNSMNGIKISFTF